MLLDWGQNEGVNRAGTSSAPKLKSRDGELTNAPVTPHTHTHAFMKKRAHHQGLGRRPGPTAPVHKEKENINRPHSLAKPL